MLKLIIKESNGEFSILNIKNNVTLNPKEDEHFYFDNYSNLDYKLDLINENKSIQLTIGTNPSIKIVFNNMVKIGRAHV